MHIMIGINGADTNERNLLAEKLNAARSDSFSSRATCTAAMRAIAPPKIAQTVRNRSPKTMK